MKKEKEQIELLNNEIQVLPNLTKEQLKMHRIKDKIQGLHTKIFGIMLFMNPHYDLPIKKKEIKKIESLDTYKNDYNELVKDEMKQLKNKYMKKCVKHNTLELTLKKYIKKHKKFIKLSDHDPVEYSRRENILEKKYNKKCMDHNTLDFTLEEFIDINKNIPTFREYYEQQKALQINDPNIRVRYKQFEGTEKQAKTSFNKLQKKKEKMIIKLGHQINYVKMLENYYENL